MELAVFIELIGTVGFPIAAVIAMGVFIYIIYKNTTKQNETNMNAVQERCAAREERLYEEIKANREVNAQALSTLAMYAERLGTIEQDVKYIKDNVIAFNAQ